MLSWTNAHVVRQHTFIPSKWTPMQGLKDNLNTLWRSSGLLWRRWSALLSLQFLKLHTAACDNKDFSHFLLHGTETNHQIIELCMKIALTEKAMVSCHEPITRPQKKKKKIEWRFYCSTTPPLHWDALGARALPCKVSVWTAWHTTSSKWGIFLEVSSVICMYFLFLEDLWSLIWK